ncbi:MAG TPA: hypothetical protein VGI81_03735 [Tepidisphaeraceae bacterium]|jgi:hypothetical protein
MIIDYPTVHPGLRWFAWPTLLAAALFAHFLVAAGQWLVWFAGILSNPYMRGEFVPSLRAATPAFALCGLSAVVLVLALRGRAVARRGVLLVLIATLALFWIDVHFQRYQVSVDIASTDYWDSGGRAHEYLTWWWYNDRWLR